MDVGGFREVLKEVRMRWLGHVLRREDDYVGKKSGEVGGWKAEK